MFDKRDALDGVLDSLHPDTVQAAKDTIAGIQRQFTGDAEGLISALVAVSTVATLIVADIADARDGAAGPVH